MGKCTFKGGVHPYDGKELSKDVPIKELFPEGDMVFPLSQHIGAPAVPVVAKGDHVLAGQLIAEAGGFISANIHSSVSGTVKAIEPRTLATGGKCNSIIIENDGKYEEVEYFPKKLEELTRDEIRERVKAAGVVVVPGSQLMSSLHRRILKQLTISLLMVLSVSLILHQITEEC